MGNLAPICSLQLGITSSRDHESAGIEVMDARALELVRHVAPLGEAGIQSLEVSRWHLGLPELEALGAALGGSVVELTISGIDKHDPLKYEVEDQLPQWFPHVGDNYRLPSAFFGIRVSQLGMAGLWL
jgi:hypothetical protein